LQLKKVSLQHSFLFSLLLKPKKIKFFEFYYRKSIIILDLNQKTPNYQNNLNIYEKSFLVIKKYKILDLKLIISKRKPTIGKHKDNN
jgi:hypothetical protein